MKDAVMKNAKPEFVLDGHDMNQDIHQLIGYVHTHGVETGKDGAFDSGHMAALAEVFLRKYNTLERPNPKRVLNDSWAIKRLVEDHKWATKMLNEKTEKLRIHEHYMEVVSRFSHSREFVARDQSWRAEEVEKIAHAMEMEANAAMKKPESFDDIEDDWTAKGVGTPDPNLAFGGEFHRQDDRN